MYVLCVAMADRAVGRSWVGRVACVCHFITRNDNQCLAKNSTIRLLDLRANYISDSGAQALVKAVALSGSSLQLLNLHCNDFGAEVKSQLERLVADPTNALESLGTEGSSAVLESVCCVQ